MLILGLHIFNFFCSYLVCRRQIQKVKGYLPSKTKMNDKKQVSRPILWPHPHHHGCSSSQRALLWKSILFASLLAHIAQAQDEVRIRWILIYHQVGEMFSIMFALWLHFLDHCSLITDQVKKNWSGWWYGQHRCVLGLHLELPPTKLSSKVKIFTWMFKIATIRKDDVCDGFLAACKGEWQQEQRGSSTRASSMTQRPELKKVFFLIFVRADLLQNKNDLTEKHSFRNALCFWLLSMSSGCWSRRWRAWLDAVDSQVGVLEVGWGRGALLRGISWI